MILFLLPGLKRISFSPVSQGFESPSRVIEVAQWVEQQPYNAPDSLRIFRIKMRFFRNGKALWLCWFESSSERKFRSIMHPISWVGVD